MRLKLGVLLVIAFFAMASAAYATARIHIDLSTQTMHVQSSSGSYSWPVSTARAGYSTPRGYFAPTGLQRMHYSRKYHMSPMPHSIFFRGGYAIHGSYETGMLGRPASHGCVRLSPGHAAMLYQMVQNEGGSISITGSPPGGGKRVASGSRSRARYASLKRSRALAYAPGRHYRHAASVRAWQAHPFYPAYYQGGF
jgi:hypothetical protein